MELSEWILKQQPGVRELKANEIWALTNERNQYRAQYHAMWNATSTGTDEVGNPTGMVDVILSPAGPGAAPPLNCSRYWSYTSQWNLLDYPAMTFPVSTNFKPMRSMGLAKLIFYQVSKVDLSKDPVSDSYVPRNDADRYNKKLCMYYSLTVLGTNS